MQFVKACVIIATKIVILLSAKSHFADFILQEVAMKSAKSIVAEVSELVLPVARELGYEIWDVEFERIGAEYHLTITIDSENGIGIEDCERMSRAIDPVLDEHDPIKEEYHLDVSSPGIERVIKNDTHLTKCTGEVIIAKLYAPIEGQKAIVGTLVSFDSESITVKGESEIQIPRKSIAKMNIYFEF